jgi:uroporphyrinogen III methyltransferase/synthase
MPDLGEPQVFLVGAGPGNADLLTVRAVECLARADLVIYDRLVLPRILDYASNAQRICVTDLAEHHVERGPLVHVAMIEAARQGKRVVRLKGGDPLIFGRGAEEAAALREAGIQFEIVPGITAAIGAAAYAGIPLTDRRCASAVAIVTGHENPAKPESVLDWGALARFPGTLVIYMGFGRLENVIRALIDNGKDSLTPAAFIRLATTGQQRTIEAPLHSLAEKVRAAGLSAPAVAVVGPVVSFRPALCWFEQRPLFGKRVLVTRPSRQAGSIVSRLEQWGAIPYVWPAVKIREPPDWSPVDIALAHLHEYQWLVLTSANGVHALVKRLRTTGRDLRALGSVQLAAIGPGTAAALREYYLQPDLVPPEFRSESLAAALQDRVRGQRVLLARADRGREVLNDEIGKIARVDQVAVYSQVDSPQADPVVLDLLRNGKMNYITLSSANIARVVMRGLDSSSRSRIETGDLQIVTISPVTSAAVREFGLPVAAEAVEFTISGLLDALVKLAHQVV